MDLSDRVEEELSQLWDSGQEWILIFDNLLKHPGGKVSKGCKCDICQMQKLQPTPEKSNGEISGNNGVRSVSTKTREKFVDLKLG